MRTVGELIEFVAQGEPPERRLLGQLPVQFGDERFLRLDGIGVLEHVAAVPGDQP